jgi:hypothetical protein
MVLELCFDGKRAYGSYRGSDRGALEESTAKIDLLHDGKVIDVR